MKSRINVYAVRTIAFLAGVLTVFALSQFFQWTAAEAQEPAEYPFKLTKNISDNYTPDPFTADQFKFNVSGYGIVELDAHTDDTAEKVIYLPAGTYTVEEIGPDGFVPADWTVQWSGYGCSGDTGNGPIRSIDIVVQEAEDPDAGGNVCRADNQWRPQDEPDTYSQSTYYSQGSYNEYSQSSYYSQGSYGGGDQCVDETQGSWADTVVSSSQALRLDSSAVLAERSNANNTLGSVDGSFFSLGFGGEIIVEFDSYVPDVTGDDFTIYEVTNGDTYPEESAEVYVSQDGAVWYLVGEANNLAGDNTSSFDFDWTGLLWINQIRFVDTTDSGDFTDTYNATTMPDGFDLDAIEVMQQVCDEPGGSDEDTYLVYGYVWHDENENDEWDQGEPDPENDLSGWTVQISNGEDTFSTTTDATGYYYFYVPVGTWIINEVLEDGWEQTYPNDNGHVVEVLGTEFTQAAGSNLFAQAFSLIVPTAMAAQIDDGACDPFCGPHDFGNVFRGGNTYSQGSYGGGYSQGSYGGGNGKKVELTSGGGSSSSSSDDEPEPQVLGETTSAFPAGAPNTGAGGASPISTPTPYLLATLLASSTGQRVRHAK